MSRRKKIRQALMGAAALYGASKLMGMGAGTTGKATVSDAQKTTQIGKKVKPKVIKDLKNPESSIVGQSTKISVDKNANPREIKEISKKAKEAKAKQFAIVNKRKKEGMLSPLMPKSESQYRAMTKENSGLDMFGGSKKGGLQTVKARGGGMARTKPTKLY
tara:strand:- start:69 stop:551 length:483 start_codon:yes stop_codon:yes gene_type:complete